VAGNDKGLGSFALVLHAHLPYVISHGTWPHGTDWLNEAAAETYIPLLNVFERLVSEGISPKVTIDVSPILAEMLSHRDFKPQFKKYLTDKIEAAKRDSAEFARINDSHMASVSAMWEGFYSTALESFTVKYNEDLIGAFRKLQDAGHIEIATCGATHGYMPLLSRDISVQAQIKQAVKAHTRHFGKPPRGIWLPECAYRPSYAWNKPVYDEEATPYHRKGVEEFLSENGIEYFFIDSHLLKGGRAAGVYMDRFSDLKVMWNNLDKSMKALPETVEKTPRKVYYVAFGEQAIEGMMPVAVFTRDVKTGLQVWSGEWGYPGDGAYLDFHKKRFPGGLRYWRVTDAKADLADKQPYNPNGAISKTPDHAAHFVGVVKDGLKDSKGGLVVSPYDCELFGHWWFEGPHWVYHVIKKMHEDGEVKAVTASEHLDSNRPSEMVSLPEGSWGEGGYHFIWLNDMNKWTWKHVYEAEKDMEELAAAHEHSGDAELIDMLKQAARELLLLEASDWQFLISTRAAADYAELRVCRHYEDFKRLVSIIRKKASAEALTDGDRNFFSDLKKRDSVFEDIELKWFSRVEHQRHALK